MATAIAGRSPCPGLNAIANHGYLPRDGRNISQEILTKALNESVNLHSSLSEFLAVHGDFIEHDASLSRADAYFGDNVSFNETIWAGSKSILFAKDPIPLASFAKAREARFQASMAENPEFHVTENQKSGSLLEMATISKLFRVHNTTDASSEWIRVLFGQ
ncbi:hypothetical protein EsH8_III_000342 [Colletotrichum jinshuiense]